MTKDQVKTICEADEKLQWWAMVLFAEISDLVHHTYSEKHFDIGHISVLFQKVNEFKELIVHNKLQESKNLPSLEQRVKLIEDKLGIQLK